MKGMVFTEFLDMVEEHHGSAVADALIARSGSATDGAYTAVGTYDHAELVRMVQALAETTGAPVPEVLRGFGRHLAGRFARAYARFFEGAPTLIDFLAGIDDHIHVEVRKLYPDAELPEFVITERGEDHLRMVYRSSRHLQDLARGLIEGTAAHYRTEVTIEQRPVAEGVAFDVRRR